jgi:hypothetical protein
VHYTLGTGIKNSLMEKRSLIGIDNLLRKVLNPTGMASISKMDVHF